MAGIDLQIERIRQAKQMDYIEAICEFAKQNGVEVEDIAKELHSSTKDKLKYDFIKRNMVKGKHVEPSLEIFMD